MILIWCYSQRSSSASSTRKFTEEEEKQAIKKEPVWYVSSARNTGSVRADCSLLNNHKFKKKKKVIYAAWDEVGTNESEDGFNEEGESLVCFMALSNDLTKVLTMDCKV